MTKHDTWVLFKTPSPYDSIKLFFPHGFPMRDPFPMYSVQEGEPASLWMVDLERLDGFQIRAIAFTVATHNEITVDEVLDAAIAAGGFAMRSQWVERLEVGPEGYQRTMELKEFFDITPDPIPQEAFSRFLNSQIERWVEGDEIPPPMPTNIDDIDPNLRTPELESAIQRNRIQQMLSSGGYSVMDVTSGRAVADIMNALETDPEVSWSLAGDEDEY